VSKWRPSAVQRGLAAISTGTAAGQAIVLLATPLLARIYTPGDFGAFASLMALVGIAATAGSLRLETAVPIASLGEARNLVKVSACASFMAGICCAVLLSGHHDFPGNAWLAATLVIYLVWITSMHAVLTTFSLRSHQYTAVARRSFLQSLGTAGGQLAAAAWLKSAMGLAAGLALGRSLGVASLARESRLFSWERGDDRPSVAVTMRRYWRFPILFMPSALLNVLGTQLPILLVVRAYGAESAGNLAQAFTFGAMPAALLGGAVSSVVLAELASRVRAGERDQRRRYLLISKALAPLGLAWFLFLFLLAPRILPVILGPEWSTSGEFAAAIAAGTGMGLIVSPLTVVTSLYERSVLNFLLDIFRVVVVLAGGVASWLMGSGPVGAVLSMSVAMGIVYVATWFVGLRIVSEARVSPDGTTSPLDSSGKRVQPS
jgi:O-antigen/teichoic acid export membrane protein